MNADEAAQRPGGPGPAWPGGVSLPAGAYVVHLPGVASDAWVSRLGEPGAERLALFGDEVSGARLVELLCTPSLTSRARLVLVRHAETMPRSEVERLVEGLRRYRVRDDWLVLWDQSQDGSLAAVVKALAGEPGAPLAILQGVPGARGVPADPAPALPVALTPGARALVEGVRRRHPHRAEQELAKLAVYSGQTLDEQAVRSLLSADLLEDAMDAVPPGEGGDRRRFEVAEAALEGDLGRALRLYGELRREGIPASWVWREVSRQAMEAWAVAEVFELRYGPGARWPPDAWKQAAGRFPGRPGWALRRLVACARRWGTEGLLKVLRWTAEADYDARRGGMEPEESLMRLLARIAGFLHSEPAPSPPRDAMSGLLRPGARR